MTNICRVSFVFWTLGSLLLATSTALVIDIQPERFTEETTGNVDITCRLDANDVEVQTILTLRIIKDQGHPLVYLQASGISYGVNGSDTTKFHAVGSINQDVSTSDLKLSILEPSQSDQGMYTCSMAYLDNNGRILERQVSTRFIVEILDIHMVVMSMRKEISDLKAQLESKVAMEINELKNSTKELGKETGALKEGLIGLNESISMEIYELKNSTQELGKETGALKEGLIGLNESMSQEIDSWANRTTPLEELTQKHTIEIHDMAERMTYNSAFSASLTGTHYVTVPIGNVFIFGDVLLRHGQGYDATTGTYTAPRRGMYVFHLSLRCYYGEQGGASIQANGVEVARVHVRTHADGAEYQSAASAVIDLNPGDQVKVVASGIERTWNGSKDSLFSGYLIKSYT